MSGYFQRLAQRSGLRGSTSNRGSAGRQPAAPANPMGLEQEQVVEVTQPSSAAAPAPHEQTPGAAMVSKPRADRQATMQAQRPIQESHSESTVMPAASSVTRVAKTTPDRRVEPAPSAVVEQPVMVGATPLPASDSKVEAQLAVARPIQSPEPAVPLELHERRLVSAQTPDLPRVGPARDQSPQSIDAASPRFAQSERRPIDVEAHTSARSQFAIGLLPQRASAPMPTQRASTAIDVRIGTVAVEIHQPAPQPVAPPPPVLAPAPAPRSGAPRERFSPSRHYIRMD